jgi:predicted DNA-binding protein with PD1-like motif
MRNLLISALLFLAVLLPAQETRRTVTHSAANAADDQRPNNPAVPDVYALDAHLQRVVVLRFKYGADLLGGLQRIIQEQKIRNAVILSGFGSVRNYQVHQVDNRDLPPKDVFVKNPSAPADIISMSGVIIHGRVHPHITLANADKAFGGHLEADTTVFTFAVVTLGVLDDTIDMSKLDDWNNR